VLSILLLMLATPPLAQTDSLAGYPGPVAFAEVDGHRIAYYQTGEGPGTVVLVHGLGSNLAFWRETIPALAEHYRVVALDLPGYGLSSKDDVAGAMDAYASVVVGLMDALGIDRAHYVGLSMGGQIGLTLALSHPHRLDRMVLASPAGIERFTPQQALALKSLFTPEAVQGVPAEQYAANVALNFAAPDSVDYSWILAQRHTLSERPDFAGYAVANARSVAGMLDGPVYDRLPTLAVPTLVIYGSGDRLIPNPYLNPSLTTAAVAQSAADASPLIDAVVVDRAGHLLPLERPEAFNRLALDFLLTP
jgi:pimeloyl-ACP methyl ester carboxylesterase